VGRLLQLRKEKADEIADMPTAVAPQFAIAAILPRADPHDALVLSPRTAIPEGGPHTADALLRSLPEGAVIGTSALRRSAQLRARYAHLRFAVVRGNVETRLRKLDEPDHYRARAADEAAAAAAGGQGGVAEAVEAVPEYAALVLAAAGLQRMGLGDRVAATLDGSAAGGGVFYAVGQAAIAIEVRAADDRLRRLLGEVLLAGNARDWRACLAERELMRALEGGCSVPLGVETRWLEEERRGSAEEALDGRLRLEAVVVSVDGTQSARADATALVADDASAEKLGRHVSQLLLEKGAGPILHAINAQRLHTRDAAVERLAAAGRP
jgi:hydroxymethylbilane synthase